MATATATKTNAPTLAPETKPARGWPDLPCCRCGAEGTITVDLSDVEGDDALCCTDCEATFPIAEVEVFIARWAPVVGWLRTAPILPPTE